MWLLYLLNFIIGIAFGFFHKGKEDLTAILKNGAVIGIILGIVFVVIAMILTPGTSLIEGFSGLFGIFVTIIIFVIIFIIGAFLGDQLERIRKH